MLTPGQDHDLTCAEPLIEKADPEALIGDKAYDADPFVETLTQRGITPVIPPKANRNIKRECDFALYCERNLVERFFNLLKHFRAIATRYDKLARNFLAEVQSAAVTILLNLNTGPSLVSVAKCGFSTEKRGFVRFFLLRFLVDMYVCCMAHR